MIQAHPTFVAPDDVSISIWRYMNLSKLVWTLQKGALFFSRCDLLGDPYEGYYPKPLVDGEADFIRSVIESPANINMAEPEKVAQRLYQAMLGLPTTIRAEMFVNCWHMNENESSAMWKLYTSQQESICVRSTYAILADVLPSECFLGQVKYIDYLTEHFDYGNLFNYIMHKRKSFQHEREARAVVWRSIGQIPNYPYKDIDGAGLVIPVDLKKLIQEVYVSPDSDPMFLEVVEGLTKTYGIGAAVKQSAVNAPPSY